ncbi:uncharacterized protein LOC117110616 [Anneissia japonica]|uniref:uncharacterized protein LOC117110616 n=1 Tax=Anneissia japonica TaxID=1529436 RepID=UPI001425BA26|nr:uncharacterized protein LOC117110616 [Anneissia japonica]
MHIRPIMSLLLFVIPIIYIICIVIKVLVCRTNNTCGEGLQNDQVEHTNAGEQVRSISSVVLDMRLDDSKTTPTTRPPTDSPPSYDECVNSVSISVTLNELTNDQPPSYEKIMQIYS